MNVPGIAVIASVGVAMLFLIYTMLQKVVAGQDRTNTLLTGIEKNLALLVASDAMTPEDVANVRSQVQSMTASMKAPPSP